MSFTRKHDFTVIDDTQDETSEFCPNDTDDTQDYQDDDDPSQRGFGSEISLDTVAARKFNRSASISVADGPTETGLSFILDLDKEESIDLAHTLHEDIEKIFEGPTMSLNELLTSGNEPVESSGRGQMTDAPLPVEKYYPGYDISSHRRSSFPHTHVPLKSLHNHSSKNFATLVDQDEAEKKEKKKKRKKKKSEEKKKKPKKSKSNIFPSKSAMLSPSIPEVEHEEYSAASSGDSDEDEDGEDEDETTNLLDVDSTLPLPRLNLSQPITIPDRKLKESEDHSSSTKDLDNLTGGLFYIGSNPQQNVPLTGNGSTTSTEQAIQDLPGSSPVIVILKIGRAHV